MVDDIEEAILSLTQETATIDGYQHFFLDSGIEGLYLQSLIRSIDIEAAVMRSHERRFSITLAEDTVLKLNRAKGSVPLLMALFSGSVSHAAG